MNKRLMVLICAVVACGLFAVMSSDVFAQAAAPAPVSIPSDDLSSYTDYEAYKVGWTVRESLPPVASTRGEEIDSIIDVIHYFMAVLFVGWGIFFVYCLVKYRARANARASSELPKAKFSKYLEIGVLGFELFLLIGLSMPIWAEVKNEIPSEDDAIVVRCVAQQFAWNFHYPGADGVFGRTSPEFMSPVNPLGLDYADAAGKDDITTINDMHIPHNRNILVKLSSLDVIHSFWIPVLRVKQDAVPGMQIPVWFTADLKDEAGNYPVGKYQVACAQLCGNNHFAMIGRFTIHDQAGYEKWLADSAPEAFDPDEFDMD